MRRITFNNNVLKVVGEYGLTQCITLSNSEAREVVRVLSSQLTPVAADLAVCATCGAELINGKCPGYGALC